MNNYVVALLLLILFSVLLNGAWIIQKVEKIMGKLDDLEAALKRNHDAEDSVLNLLTDITQQLKDAQATGDPAKVDALIADVEARTERLAAATVAGTPGEPT